MTSTGFSRRWIQGIVILAAALVTAFGVGLFMLLRDSLDPLEESASNYLGHLGREDGQAACSAMTRTARAELTATYRAKDCPAAIQAMIEPLTSAEKSELADTDTRYPKASGLTGYVDLGSNPLDLSQLVLKDVDGTWHITDLR
ncbi:hypothetical protein [Streptomyces aureus]|uniref:hypothetical protein n=1 Tax=Streptomyces aureus TaxID=193461 RepID=UPI00131C4F62|nr:hypothetical protein [Streptomyces aureus]